jgi:hypothetical protein
MAINSSLCLTNTTRRARIQNFLEKNSRFSPPSSVSHSDRSTMIQHNSEILSSQFLKLQTQLAEIADHNAQNASILHERLVTSANEEARVVAKIENDLDALSLRMQLFSDAIKNHLVLFRTKELTELNNLQDRLDALIKTSLESYAQFEQRISQEILVQQVIQKKISSLAEHYEKIKQEASFLQHGLLFLKEGLSNSNVALLEIAKQEALLNQNMAEVKHAIQKYQSQNSQSGWLLIAVAITAVAICTLIAPPIGVAAGNEISLGIVLSGEGASLTLTSLGGALAGGAILASTKEKEAKKVYAMSNDSQPKMVEESVLNGNKNEEGVSGKMKEIAFKQAQKKLKQTGMGMAGNLIKWGYLSSKENTNESASPLRDRVIKGGMLLAQEHFLRGVNETTGILDFLAKKADPGPLLDNPAIQESFKKCLENASSIEDCQMHVGVQLAMMKNAHDYLGKPAEFLQKIRHFGEGRLIGLCDQMGIKDENILDFLEKWAKSIDEIDLY